MARKQVAARESKIKKGRFDGGEESGTGVETPSGSTAQLQHGQNRRESDKKSVKHTHTRHTRWKKEQIT